MAEEQNAGGQNLWLLLVSLGLGLVVVVIYNVHIHSVRNAARGQSIELISLARDVDAGEKLRAEDLEIRIVPKQYQESLGTVVTGEDLSFAVGQQVNRGLEKGRWLLWDYITGGVGERYVQIKPGCVAKAVELDSKRSPGDILRPNDRVNILGFIEGKACRLLKGVTVLAVAGKGDDRSRVQKGGSSLRVASTYNSITVELPALPQDDVALQWDNLLTHVNGSCWVELRPANENPSVDFNRIAPELKKLTEGIAKPARGELPTGSGGGGGRGGTDGVTVPGSRTWE